jgi:tRNA pseudouridine38-40 synthase
MRYFARLAYRGTRYFGWQRQLNQISVQEKIEDTFQILLRQPVEVTGCGRTDAGVHASDYVLHFDFETELPEQFLRRLNSLLPPDIVFYSVHPVLPDAHARFDATSRSYEYHMSGIKDPFREDTVWMYRFFDKLDHQKLQQSVALLLDYEEFFPFCKTRTDVQTMKCKLRRSEWIISPDGKSAVYHVTSDRFLRGMIRLIVGMSISVASGKLSIEQVKNALDSQSRLIEAVSVPPQGLFLKGIQYPFF